MTIHSEHPFATPEEHRSPVRRFRGRLVSPVTVWTAPGPAGLTVSSTLVADGDPGRVLGLIDEDSDLWDAVEAAGVFAVTPLGRGQQDFADRFAGLAPAPGGLFAQDQWVDTAYGPVLATATTWAGCRVDTVRRCGWALLVDGIMAHAQVGEDHPPVVRYRGRYRALSQ